MFVKYAEQVIGFKMIPQAADIKPLIDFDLRYSLIVTILLNMRLVLMGPTG